MANQTIDIPFKSQFYQEERRKLLEPRDAFEDLWDQVEKKKRYSEIVQQNFKPRISLKKKK